MSRILLLEDDLSLIDGLTYSLKKQGYETAIARTVKEALALFAENEYDLLLLDLALPDGSGFDFCKTVRATSRVPIIFLTASDEEVNMIMGLDMGGDDYITKPFHLPVLLSRIRAVLRRNASPETDSDVLTCGNIRLVKSRTEVFVEGKPVELRTLEYRLLETLLESKYMTLTRTRLLERLWDDDGSFVYDNTLTVTMKRLREKVGENSAQPRYLKTVRGIGYKAVDQSGR